MRALVAVGAAILSFGLLTGTANASTLSASQNFPYSGTFAPPIMENLLGSSAGCANGTETNCQFFQFVVNEPGCTATTPCTATYTLTTPDVPNVVEASIDCNGENILGVPVPRDGNTLDTDPTNGQGLGDDEFSVVNGDVCTIRVTIVMVANPFDPVSFSGVVSLTLVTPLENAWVSGGGQVLLPNTSFSSNAKPKKEGGFKGNVRYYDKNDATNCKYQSTTILSLDVQSVTSGGVTYKQALITGVGRLNTGTGWTDDPVQFHAKAEDHGKTGDRFVIDKCGSVDSEVLHGQITIHQKQ